MAVTYIIMGVSGSGKTTVGTLLAQQLSLPFYDADAFHSEANVAKMAAGIPLTDEDRLPWLQALQTAMGTWTEGAVLACSALKESYRRVLAEGHDVVWVYLKGSFKTILQRMEARNHFMKPELLQSQFDVLEPPSYGLHVEVSLPPQQLVSEIITNLGTMNTSAFGIIGMGVMGRSLAQNVVGHGFSLSVYNRWTEAEKDVIPSFLSKLNHPKLQGFTNLSAFVQSLTSPRKILLMIPAGSAVDTVLAEITPLLHPGDILMDGGNSHYKDTQRREKAMKDHGFHYMGLGISGGEQGALTGPSLMAGGASEAYQYIKAILESIAAKDIENQPCVSLLGTDGCGHYVKTLHNGIEYAEMQLLAEIYALLKPSLSYNEMAALFSEWNEGELQSFLLETTIRILRTKEHDGYVLDTILDVAQSKGTGAWSSHSALEQGIPANILMEAVMARAISSQKQQRSQLAQLLAPTPFSATIDTETLKQAYQFARILNHLQGLGLIQATAKAEGWELDIAEVVRIWSRGCILQSALLQQLYPLLQQTPNLWEEAPLVVQLSQKETAITEILLQAMEQRTPTPCLSAAYQYWLGMTKGNSAANLIQAQRDAFGAHTFKRIDDPEGESFTHQWNPHG
ncbi:MAG: NADP-dependent phosphogluconate dehydrogenase [Flavobacteriaceae bacterium]